MNVMHIGGLKKKTIKYRKYFISMKWINTFSKKKNCVKAFNFKSRLIYITPSDPIKFLYVGVHYFFLKNLYFVSNAYVYRVIVSNLCKYVDRSYSDRILRHSLLFFK